jgi:hypothetical protein
MNFFMGESVSLENLDSQFCRFKNEKRKNGNTPVIKKPYDRLYLIE